MRWILLLVGITFCTLAFGQSTLKIYVAIDDMRSDMDIIDINTSSLDRYGQSVDSTNIKFYATTMSTQVLRISRVALLGEEELKIDEVESIEIPSFDTALPDKGEGAAIESSENLSNAAQNAAISKNTVANRSAESDRSYTKKATAKKRRAVLNKKRSSSGKKIKKIKRYKGQCPKFF